MKLLFNMLWISTLFSFPCYAAYLSPGDAVGGKTPVDLQFLKKRSYPTRPIQSDRPNPQVSPPNTKVAPVFKNPTSL